MSEPIRLTVFGTAKPQGSKTGFIRGGRVVMVEGGPGADREGFKSWREAVASAARTWQGDHNAAVLDEAVEVNVTFHLARPKSAPRWKVWASTSPDLDKLARNVLDAITGTVLVNDSRVVRLFAEKLYTLDAPRAEIVVTPLGGIERISTTGPMAERSA